MKICRSSLCAARFVVLAIFFLMCCSDEGGDTDPKDQEPNENEEEITPEKADAIMEAFSFIAATKVSGSMPTVSNTTLTKTSSKDTIYTLPGIKDVIRISHPAATPIKGIYITVSASTFYYNVEIEREEASDTVAVTFIEIDPGKIEEELSSGSTSVPVEIIPYDESNTPLDIIERIVTIEKPQETGGCNLLEHNWYWEWSVLLNHLDHPYNLNSRGERNRNDFIFKDCCLGASCPNYDENQNPVYDVEIPISLYYTIIADVITFYSDGLFERQTMEGETYISNPGDDPATFDPCEWTPEISRRTETVNYYGTHDYIPGDKTMSYIITDTSCDEGEIGCGFGGSVVGAEVTVTCHTLVLTKGGAENKSVKMFTRGKTADMEGEILDKDKFWD